ncbi:MAG: hypothetical protein L6R38_001744 [Xanthoria sp. 2 TBL-2021]|nr:MAG: hypothetical protein L6R38_001744 [Xanthoria sp. 2 TBL-2021]
MTSRATTLAFLNLPAAVLEKLALLDRSIEDLLLDYENNKQCLEELGTALRQLVRQLSALHTTLQGRADQIRASQQRHSNPISYAHQDSIGKFAHGVNTVSCSILKSFISARDLLIETNGRYIGLCRAYNNW